MPLSSGMGPPASPRETRRSGRRSAPSASTSASKSPDSDQPPKQRDTSSRPAPSSTAGSARNKRLKQEDLEDTVDERKVNTAPSVTPNSTSQGAVNGKGKRKAKEKEKDKQGASDEQADEASEPIPEDGELAPADEEEQGITRCVCGSAEDDPDAGEFMIQCEACKVWQHGPCMGFMTEDQVLDEDYYCEECKPELHTDLLKRLSQKKGRHASHHNSNTSRVSRSRSPSQFKLPSKRRNTMNSRDFDESLKEVMEATAAEAAGKDPAPTHSRDEQVVNEVEHEEVQAIGKKKRKRAEEEPAPTKKRTRSASTTSDRPASTHPRDETPVSTTARPTSQAPAPAKGGGRNKRGGRKAAAPEAVIAADGEEAAPAAPATTTNKRQGNMSRKGGAKRPPLSHAISHNSNGTNQEHAMSRARNPTGINQHSAANAEARAYRNSHAYAVSQQPLLTSWGLPDYLSHLAEMLPTQTPMPLEVRSGASSGERGESAETTVERGVKVKWPAKRMSVGDMNKRVRALVEAVGREQANALDRERRREALEMVLKEQQASGVPIQADTEGDVVMAVDGPTADQENSAATPAILPKPVDKGATSSTMRLMEELMEELIVFQEKFGPGAKTRERRQGQTAS